MKAKRDPNVTLFKPTVKMRPMRNDAGKLFFVCETCGSEHHSIVSAALHDEEHDRQALYPGE
jgi:hypothetical protein